MRNPEHFTDDAKMADRFAQTQTYRGSVVPFRERITCTIPEACQAIGLGRSKVYELMADGQLRTMTIGRRRLVVVASLLRLVTSDSAETATP